MGVGKTAGRAAASVPRDAGAGLEGGGTGTDASANRGRQRTTVSVSNTFLVQLAHWRKEPLIS